MIEFGRLLLVAAAGAALGVVFFGGLWVTVRRGLAGRPLLWFVAGSVLRMALILAVFYTLLRGDWRNGVAALLGFSGARLASTLMVSRRRSQQCI